MRDPRRLKLSGALRVNLCGLTPVDGDMNGGLGAPDLGGVVYLPLRVSPHSLHLQTFLGLGDSK